LSNFILSFEGIIKICDFGTCSFAKESCSLVGTLHYLAPEVIDLEENDSYGPKVDCWSLGITALEIYLISFSYVNFPFHRIFSEKSPKQKTKKIKEVGIIRSQNSQFNRKHPWHEIDPNFAIFRILVDDPPGLNLVMKNENIPKIIKEILNDMLNKLPNERLTSSDLLVKLSNSSLDLQDDRIILRKIIYCLSNRHKNGVLKRLKLSFDASKNLLNNPVILENSEEFQDLKRIPSKRIVSAENCKTYSEIKSIIYRKNEKLKKIGSRVKLEKNNFIKDTETVHKKYSAIKMKELSKIKEEYMSKIKINQDRYHKCIQEFNGPIFNSLISKNNQFRHRSLLRNFDHLFTDKTIDIKHINIKNAVQQIIKSKYSEIQLKNEKEYLESISNIDISIINLYRDKWKLIKIDNNKILKKLYEEKRLVRLISIEKAFSCIIFDLEKMMKENKISPSTKSNIGLKEKLKPIFRILSASVFIPCREGNIKNFTEKLTNLHCSNMEVYQLLMQNTEFEASSDLKDKLQECLESTEILKNDVEDKYKNLIKKLDKELVEGEKKFEGQISEIRKDVRNKITAESEKYFIEANNATLSCQKFLNHRASLVSAAQCIYSDLLEKL
ncbi:MAG: signal transducing kinase of the PAK, partial [Paramarteilia canceri]